MMRCELFYVLYVGERPNVGARRDAGMDPNRSARTQSAGEYRGGLAI